MPAGNIGVIKMNSVPFSNTASILVEVERTYNSGIPCMWESGGATITSGESTIICTEGGLPKAARAIKHPTNGKHALIPIEPGTW